MPVEPLAELAHCSSLGEATMVKTLLNACGIEAFVSIDDAGGVQPVCTIAGVRVFVNSRDLQKAKEVIDNH